MPGPPNGTPGNTVCHEPQQSCVDATHLGTGQISHMRNKAYRHSGQYFFFLHNISSTLQMATTCCLANTTPVLCQGHQRLVLPCPQKWCTRKREKDATRNLWCKRMHGQSCHSFSLKSKVDMPQYALSTGNSKPANITEALVCHCHTGILSALQRSAGTCSLEVSINNGPVEHQTNHRVCEPPLSSAGSAMVLHLLSVTFGLLLVD